MDKDSRVVPVTLNLVLTSPTAVPASSAETAMLPYTVFMVSCKPSSSLPVAPVLVATVSRPASTSLKAATDAVPIAAIGAVTYLLITVPTEVTLLPNSVTFVPAFVNAADRADSEFLACVSNFFKSCSVSTISL